VAESPSALLERAAAKIEDLAHNAPTWPWRMGGDGDLLGDGPTPIVYSEYGDVEVQWADGVFEWVCPMSPAIAAPLVEWLRDAASSMRKHRRFSPDGSRTYHLETGPISPSQRSALAFARVVLGEHTEEAS